jgi:hypothetical protein
MPSHQWNHFLAQSYLKGFSPYYYQEDATRTQKMKVWCFDKGKKTIELVNVDKVARKSRWYSLKTGEQSYKNDLEESFAVFEHPYRSLIAKIRSWIDFVNHQAALDLDQPLAKILTDIERAYLASYIVLHMMRVPSAYGKIREMAKNQTEKDPRFDKAFEESYGSGDFGNAAVIGFLNSAKKLAPRVISTLLEKNIDICFSVTRKLDVLTGDQPVLRDNNLQRVVFPLFQRAWVDLHGYGKAIRINKIKDETFIHSLNVNVCGIAQEQVFGSNKDTIVKAADHLHLEYRVIEPTKGSAASD